MGLWYITQRVDCGKKKMKIFICGFTGAGKTTALEQFYGREEFSNYRIVDLDLYLTAEKLKNESISSFIQSAGMDAFRALELGSLMELSKEENLVVALGGGALNELTLGLLSQWKGIFLGTPFDICHERISGDDSRPMALLSKDDQLVLYQDRVKLYSQYPQAQNVEEVLEIANQLVSCSS